MKIYLIAGTDLHQSIAGVLEKNGYRLVGYEYTIDAAVIALKNKTINADLLIINGLAQVSGIAQGEINRNQSMLIKLREIRMSVPQIRILLLLPKQNPMELIRNVLSLGIYDIRQVSSFNSTELLGWINNPMTIANYQDFSPGKTPDCPGGEIKYKSIPEEFEKRQFVSKLPQVVEKKNRTTGTNEKKRAPIQIYDEKKSKSKLSLMLIVGDARIENWIKEKFSFQVDIIIADESKDVRAHIEEVLPDICIIMRLSSIGGIKNADDLAVWAVNKVTALIFIIGELDAGGKEMFEKVTQFGVRNIISCEKGGFISGDELIYMINGVMREIQDSSGLITDKANPAIDDFKNKDKYSMVTKLIKPKTNKRKKSKPRSVMFKGLPFDEEIQASNIEYSKNPIVIFPGGIFIIVSPWRPNLAGRLAAQAVELFSEVEGGIVAYIGASKDSTGALWLNIPEEELVLCDWRVPGSRVPIEQDNIRIFAVDPSKNLDTGNEEQFWQIANQARRSSTYTVIDFAGDTVLLQKALVKYKAVVLVALPGNDPVERKLSLLWFKNFCEGKENVIAGIDLRGASEEMPRGVNFKVIIRNNPADALLTVLKRKNEEFVWI